MKDNEASAFGFLNYAERYRIAANLVIGNARPEDCELAMPAYHLLAQSIELSLKAFLRSVGISERNLAGRHYGHNLELLLGDCLSQGLLSFVALDDLQTGIIGEVSKYHVSHEFRYLRPGVKNLPYWDLLDQIAKSLTYGLHDRCLSIRIGQQATEKRVRKIGRFQ